MSIESRPRFVTAEDRYSATDDNPDHSPAEAVVYRFWRHHHGAVPAPLAGQLRGPWPQGLHDQLTAHAYVNHGRWCVDCPYGCGSAQYASHSDRRFFCVDCANRGDPRWVPVAWPSELELTTIEAVLSVRPDPTTQNWRPGEAIDELTAENTGHGYEVAT